MSVAPILARLYPVVLALANIAVGVGLYATGTLFFAVLMWTGGVVVLVWLGSPATPARFRRHDETRELQGQAR
jgi:membrane protein implicated in regulation of membrane protease activity